jgi:hypothetical protein
MEAILEDAPIFEQIRRARARVGQGSASAPTLTDAEAPIFLAQGDSWFNYWVGKDLLYWLGKTHKIDSIAVAGSTLNDVVYGPVPTDFLDFRQTDAPSRLDELRYRIIKDKPLALLFSVGGNDVAGDSFFSFIDNAKADLPHTNQEVLDGVVNLSFLSAYRLLIKTALAAADSSENARMKVFTHGYDYPWPDGRGVLWIKGLVGPWFDPTFTHKNYPLKSEADLLARRAILKVFIDRLNDMLVSLEGEYPGRLHHVNLRATLGDNVSKYRDQWANELHPTDPGFEALAQRFGQALSEKL